MYLPSHSNSNSNRSRNRNRNRRTVEYDTGNILFAFLDFDRDV